MNLFKQSLTSVIFKMINIPITIIIGIITAQMLGPEGKGIYTVIVTISTFISILGMLGMGNSSIFLVNSRGYDFKKVYSSLFWFSILWGLVIVGISAAVFGFLPSIIGKIETGNINYIYIISFLMILNGFISPMLLTKQRIREIGIISIISLVFQLGFIITAYFVYPEQIFYFVVLSYIASIFITIGAAIVYEKSWYLFVPAFNLKILKDVFEYGIKIFIGNLTLVLNMQFDMLLMNYFRTPREVGIYSVSVMLCNFLLVIPGAIGPVLYSNWSKNKVIETDEVIRASRIIFFLLFFIGCGLAVFGYPFIIIAFGAAFAGAYIPLVILLPGVIHMGLCYSLFNYFSSRGKPEITSGILFVCFLINLGLNIIFIPKIGINGAAISSLISYSLSALLALIYFARTKSIGLREAMAQTISLRKMLFDIKEITGDKV